MHVKLTLSSISLNITSTPFHLVKNFKLNPHAQNVIDHGIFLFFVQLVASFLRESLRTSKRLPDIIQVQRRCKDTILIPLVVAIPRFDFYVGCLSIMLHRVLKNHLPAGFAYLERANETDHYFTGIALAIRTQSDLTVQVS